jgi:2-amino-4-hydroxy-6-hydroxymethyldihydropteridine diphosphokinase
MRSTYVIAIGSNRRGRHGGPAQEVTAAIAALGDVRAASHFLITPPLGPSKRRFVNAAAVIETAETPPELLDRLKHIERASGRRHGQRWGARVIDLDIVLWSGGVWADGDLVIPHPAFRQRGFVLAPLRELVPDWRDPITGRTIRQLAARLTRRAATPRAAGAGPGP